MEEQTNADQGANATGGGGVPNGGGQGSQQSTQARGTSDDGSRADPKAAGGKPAGTHSEADVDELKAEIAKLKASNAKLEDERKEAVARRKAEKAKAEGTKTEAEKATESIKAALEAKHTAETRARDVIDAVIDKHPGANPKLLRMLVKGSGIDLQAEDTKATMEAIDKLLNDETLAPLKAGVPDVPGSGGGGRTVKIGTYHPVTGQRLL